MSEFINGITYSQLTTFKSIFEAGNIAKASRTLGVSAASVSQSLKLLEKQIQEPLFIRSTRRFKPTELGEQLYDSSRFAMEDLSLAVERICEKHSMPTGTLKLNMAKDIYDVFLKDVLQEFQQLNPLIELDITLSDFMDERVEKSIDIGFRFGETVKDNLIARPLPPTINPKIKQVKAALFAGQSYIEAYGLPHDIEALKRHSFIKFRAPTSGKIFPIRVHRTADPASEILSFSNLSTALVANDTQVVIDMALNGQGIGNLMDASITEHLDSGKLVPILQDNWCDIPAVYMYYAPENKQSSRVRCFLDFINAKLK